MHKHAHKHANINKHACMFTHNYIYLNIQTLGKKNREPNTAKSKTRRESEQER